MTSLPALRPLRGKGPAYAVVDMGFTSPCWLWLGCTNSKGYPVRGTKDSRYLVHRAVLRESGHRLEERQQGHHRCEQTLCVNPEHLEAVSPLGHASRHRTEPSLLERCVALLADSPSLTPASAAASLGASRDTLTTTLHRAVRDGRLARPYRGVYALKEAA